MATLATFGSTSVLRFSKPEPLKEKPSLPFLGSLLPNSMASNLLQPASSKSRIIAFLPALQPVARRCPFTGKKANKANHVFFLEPQDEELQFVNLQFKKFGGADNKEYLLAECTSKQSNGGEVFSFFSLPNNREL
ncbi:putative Splicing factor U2AF 50 kDa subunit [Hibiscus syriacus]|uniref:Splicing factor U2AF 50 kDa subunit n=1 Tax=Hibiscus syriacus TaxID=106335 RepID=A0A6A2ZAA9_HIBSY|nr:putative Splicing factor U2AF 50 kDa subunit [Hibiscus syriacus]